MENQNKAILVVEDEEIMRRLLAQGFTDEGFSVLEAKNGEEGLKLSLEKHPDLVVLDVAMPKMDGMTMMRKVRESGLWGKKVPIIILTNLNANDAIMAGVIQNEPSYYFMKTDFQIEDLVKKVKEELQLH